MSNFFTRCPKCTSTTVSLNRDKRSNWTGDKNGLPVFSCSNCGKTLYGQDAIEEVEKQYATWSGTPRKEPVPVPPAFTVVPAAAPRGRPVDPARPRLASGDRLRSGASDLRREAADLPDGSVWRNAVHAAQLEHAAVEDTFVQASDQVEIHIGTLERLTREVSTMDGLTLYELQTRMKEVRRVLLELPLLVEKAVALAQEEAASRPVPVPFVPPAPPLPPVPLPLEPPVSPTCAWQECSNAPHEDSKYCSRTCSNKNARYQYALRKMQSQQVEAAG